MKYSLPKLNISLLSRAREYLYRGMEDYKKRNLKTRGALLTLFFDTIDKFFNTVGSPSTGMDLAVKEGEPRSGPSSVHYNKFIDSLDTDLSSAYEDHNSAGRASLLHFNYAQAQRSALDGILKEVDERLKDLSVMTDIDSRDVYFRDTFSTDERVDKSASTGRNNLGLGVYELGYSSTTNVLQIPNIEKIAVSAGFPSLTLSHSKPYYGRRYGVIPTDSGTSGSEFPRKEDPGIRDVTSPWDTTPLRYLVDDKSDTLWEVELTAREDYTGKTSGGPYMFLRDAGEDGTLAATSTHGTIYKYDNGHMIYSEKSYPASSFKSDGKISKYPLSTSITITLREPQDINALSIERADERQYTDTGNLHAIYVTDIELAGVDGEFRSIPIFSRYAGVMTTDGTVLNRGRISDQTRATSDVLSSSSTPEEKKRTTTPTTTKASEPRGDAGAKSVSQTSTSDLKRTPSNDSGEVMVASSSKYSSDDTWTFSKVPGVKTIRITLVSNEPCRVRYSMGRFKVTTDRILGSDKVNWIFAQYTADDFLERKLPESSTPKDLQSKIMYYTSIPGVYKAISSLFSKTTMDPVPTEIHTLDDRSQSDIYRWSIGIAGITANSSEYSVEGIMISREWRTSKPIDRIMIYTKENADGGSIDWYIIPGDSQGVRILPYESREVRKGNGRYIPKILYVNSNLPQERREKSKWGADAFIDITEPLYRVRVQAVLTRGEDSRSTPRIDEYRVRVIHKELGGSVKNVIE